MLLVKTKKKKERKKTQLATSIDNFNTKQRVLLVIKHTSSKQQFREDGGTRSCFRRANF